MRISDWSSDVCSSDLSSSIASKASRPESRCPNSDARRFTRKARRCCGNGLRRCRRTGIRRQLRVSACVAAFKTVRPELVEGLFFFATSKEEQGFERLRTNGGGAVWRSEEHTSELQ